MLALALALQLIAADPVAHVDQGDLKGQALADGGAVFRGVPYAQPPVGDLRWRDPQPAQSWSGQRSATDFALACTQVGVSMPGEVPTPSGEDCLYLNVWTPDQTPDRPLPVIVWVPGGGLANGSTAAPVYDGANLARHGAVVITVGYRLGVLGFLTHPELTAEGGGASGNYGLMDQIAALQWVHDNVEAFGGDPANVTVAGQSAGATSVSILMASPRAKGLMHRAIGQSGGLFEPPALAPRYQLAKAEEEGVALAQSLNVTTLAELRALPAEQLAATPANRRAHPVFESRVMPRPPYDVFRSGEQAQIPLLVGFNADEARSLSDFSTVTAENLDAELRRRWGGLPPDLFAAYRGAEPADALAAFERDLRFGWDIVTWARLQAASGQPAFLYRFDRQPPAAEGSVEQNWRAGHFVDLWYMFDNLDQHDWAWTTADRALADRMAEAWLRFARTGNPNPPDRAFWPAVSDADGPVLILDEAPYAGSLPGVEALGAFDAVYDSLRAPPAQP